MKSPLRFCFQQSFVLGLLFAGSSLGCQTEEAKECAAGVERAGAKLGATDPNDRGQLEGLIGELEGTRKICEKARRTTELADIDTALTNVRELLSRHEEREKKEEKPGERSEEEWAKVQKEGDPLCPRGQSYPRPAQPTTRIECTGPSVLEANWEQTLQQFTRMGFQMMQKPSALRAVKGPLAITLDFEKTGSSRAATCVTVNVPPGQDWQPVVASLTSVPPTQLKKDEPIVTKKGPVEFKVKEVDSAFELELGECPAPAAPAPTPVAPTPVAPAPAPTPAP